MAAWTPTPLAPVRALVLSARVESTASSRGSTMSNSHRRFWITGSVLTAAAAALSLGTLAVVAPRPAAAANRPGCAKGLEHRTAEQSHIVTQTVHDTFHSATGQICPVAPPGT